MLGRRLRWEQALASVADCQKNALQGALLTYTRAISAFDKSHRWQHALACLEDLRVRVVRADTILYNSVT